MPTNGFRPARFVPPEKLVILTDGTCGSACASFTKIPQEAKKATFVGAGGIWNEGMDVASYAGGLVSNPDYLSNIAEWSNTTFPKFLTNQKWQFTWATWYSAKLPSRPTQFTVQEPNYREPFWGFPHSSINSTITTQMVSELYDNVIDSTLARLTVLTNAEKSSCTGHVNDSIAYLLIAICCTFGISTLAIATIFWVKVSKDSYAPVAKDEKLVRTLLP
jgi:hypothetical protein